ncbi:MAG: AMP-binding protein, partial [Burkholderiales bacterium]
MTRPLVIRKDLGAMRIEPNLVDWERTRAQFSWQQAREALHGLPGGGLNIAFEAVERHARGPRAGHVAIRWLGRDGASRDLTYAELSALSNRFANALASLGLRAGDRIFMLASRLPELYVAVLGALKAGLVVSPLFSAFGPEPIATRMNLGEGRAIVTTAALFRRKLGQLRERVASLEHLILIPEPGAEPDAMAAALAADARNHDMSRLLAEAS